MRLRRSRSLIITFGEYGSTVFNFLKNSSFVCSPLCIELLSKVEDWQEESFFFSELNHYSVKSVAEEVIRLVELGALVVEGTELASRDEDYSDAWEWGVAAALYHFGIKDCKYCGEEETRSYLSRRAQSRPSPHLYTTNSIYNNEILFNNFDCNNIVFLNMLRRRSRRGFAPTGISKQQLGDCLFAGLGITGYVEDPIIGQLPLKTTPSGGARNPYEAYVYVHNVEGVLPGIYHYSSSENSLGRLEDVPLVPARHMLGDQEWVDDAAAIVFLVANFDRTMWKYPHPSAYRVVLIEAGHIGQNIALAATALGLAAATTCAICDSVAEAALRLTSITQSVIYAVVLGDPDPSSKWSITYTNI
jgi:SagB-type dehydrogenase family enzyme